jgi:anti-sigma regulatory factor (Ser/Thr protein kinase)
VHRGEFDVSLDLPSDEHAPALSRAALTGLASEIGMRDPLLADMKVVLSEVVLNAISHGAVDGGGRVRVELSGTGGVFRAVVTDSGPGLAAGHPEGTGMSVLRQLADTWAVEDRPDGPGVRVDFSKRI